MIALRPALIEQAETLAAIHAAAFEDPWDADVMESFLRASGAFALLAGSPAAGFVLGRRIAGEAEILTLAVDPPHRRRGVGAALLAGAVDFAREACAQAMFLEVACDNAAALAMYAAAAFSEVGRRRAYYSRPNGPVDALVLRRDLNR